MNLLLIRLKSMKSKKVTMPKPVPLLTLLSLAEKRHKNHHERDEQLMMTTLPKLRQKLRKHLKRQLRLLPLRETEIFYQPILILKKMTSQIQMFSLKTRTPSMTLVPILKPHTTKPSKPNPTLKAIARTQPNLKTLMFLPRPRLSLPVRLQPNQLPIQLVTLPLTDLMNLTKLPNSTPTWRHPFSTKPLTHSNQQRQHRLHRW